MTIDNSVHSFFGVSKCSADLITQEFGKNIGMKTEFLDWVVSLVLDIQEQSYMGF